MTTRHRCWAEIDLGALESNLRRIRAGLPQHVKYVAVVKADAYGHGMAQTVARLMHCGADMFAVANVREAEEIREIGSGWPILILSPVLPEEDDALLDSCAIPTVSCLEEVERFAKLGERAKRPFKIHLKVDTGMGRLGVWHTQAKELYEAIRAIPQVALEGIFTHFSSADSDAEFTEHQRQLFIKTLESLPGIKPGDLMVHADNSAGLNSFLHGSWFNAVRIGLRQFGVLPYRGSILSSIPTHPVFNFHTRVGLVKNVPAGTGISYSRSHILQRDSRLALLTAGYGDGIPTTLSNRGQVLIRGKHCPMIGRVTMDQTVIDVTDHPNVQVGDVATLIGKQENQRISVSEFAREAQHIPWEIFCSITKRVPRHYVLDSAL